MTELVTFRISGKAMSVIEGSELSCDPVKYDGGSNGAHTAYQALSSCSWQRRGKGLSYTVTVHPDGAEVIRDYCQTVGETFTGGGCDPEAAADGRALLKVAEAIEAVLQ